MLSKIALIAGVAMMAGPVAAQTARDPWATMAERDLHAIHDLLRDNHPGAVDPQNPQYKVLLEQALKPALVEAAAAHSFADYARALRRYNNAFQDGHTSVSFTLGAQTTEWPGFIARDDSEGRMTVLHAEPDAGVKVGDVIESCDGQSVDALKAARVDPYYWNAAIPHDRRRVSFRLFVLDPADVDLRLKHCRTSAGEATLNWREMPAQAFNDFRIGVLFGDAQFALKSVDGVWIVRLPKFYASDDKERAQFDALIAELTAKAPDLRKGVVVFDVRGNGGGDSEWGARAAAALWSKAWVDRIENGVDSTHDWRVSPANLKHVDDIVEMVRAREPDSLPYWTHVQTAMKAADARGQPLGRVDMPATPAAGPPPPNPVTGHVYLLADGGCGSACLDFADVIRNLPGVVQIGEPTAADALYIDINTLPLPSGLGSLNYGMKVYRHRMRANNQWYDPQVRWTGGPMTDEAIAQWVRSLPM
jgi:Peptidase family S41